jgi:hypothetical protein
MFSFINSIFKITGGTNSESTFRKTIISALESRKIKYSEVLSGINFTLTNFNDYNIIIPESFIDDKYIQIKLSLKDKDSNSINCIYLYKLIENKLRFINRIKIIDTNSIKCDEDKDRIDDKLIRTIDDILLEISKNNPSSKVGGNNRNYVETSQDETTQDETSQDDTTQTETTQTETTQTETTQIETTQDETTQDETSNASSIISSDSITTTDKLDMKYLISNSRYRNLQKIMNLTVSD